MSTPQHGGSKYRGGKSGDRQLARSLRWRAAALVVALVVAASTAAPSAAAAAEPAPEPAAVPLLSIATTQGPQPAATAASAATISSFVPAPTNNSTANSTASSGNSTAGAPKFGMIVVFRDAATLARMRMMCNSSPLLYRLFYRALRLPADCHMPGVCRRIYSETITGFAGDFTEADLARLERCLPPSSVFYKEPDAQVFKAEDSPYWHPAEGPQQPPLEPLLQRRRLLQNQPLLVPRVESFEERTKTSSSAAIPLDIFAVSQGRNISQPGLKAETVTSQSWNLDRLDQRALPLDGRYVYGSDTTPGTGKGTTIYVVDSGVRLSHQEFRTQDGSRSRASYGYDFVEDDDVADDCDGHGTHVSGTAIGLQVGVAKEAEVVAVRILDCTGSGTISDTVAALDWVAANHKKPAVVTLSLGIQVGSWSRVLEDAVRSLTNDHGVTVVVASGNSAVDACYVAPADVPEVITVAASNVATKYNGTKAGDPEDIYRWSNTGPCIDIFAPGVDIFSACGGPSRCDTVSDSAYTYASGTSMAVPHVAGVAAVYLGSNPDAAPTEVASAIIAASTQNTIVSTAFKPGTPNRLLYSRLGASSSSGQEVQAASGP